MVVFLMYASYNMRVNVLRMATKWYSFFIPLLFLGDEWYSVPFAEW